MQISSVKDVAKSVYTLHLKVDFGSSSGHAEAQGWYIDSSITFPKDEEVIMYELWELDKETLQGSVIIISDLRERHAHCTSCF